MQATARRLSVVSATSAPSRRLIRNVRPRNRIHCMSDGGATVFFRGAYSYRTTGTGTLAILLLLFFLPLLVLFAREFFRPHSTSELLLGVGLCIFAGSFVFVGATLGYYCLTSYSKPLTIDMSGVTYGRKHFPWDTVATVGKDRRSPALQLMLQKRGRISLSRPIWVDGGLSQAQFKRLMRDLSAHVTPLHPHTQFGLL